MRNKTVALLIIISLLGLVGCSSVDNQNPSGEGYIFEKSNGRVLILNNVDPKDIGKKWYGISESYQGEAIWLSTKKSNLIVGQYVRYWIKGGVNNSFPSQASAKKIEIIEK